jgi:oligo-1,6-glucosidase
MLDRPWWHSAVVYQIYPRSFADSDGDGIGDLGGIRARLDHLAYLGVDVVWLSPIYRSPMDDNGYDISDYQAIDPVFGTLAQFDELVSACHDRGIKLLMDLVVNHTSDEHPWFVESRSSRDNPKRDWYLWRDTPNNWQSFFSGPAWELDETTGQHYLHLFSRKQPDLNWDNPEVRQAIHAMMRWWLDRGVDGFRMDVINMISKTAGLPDGTVPGLRGGEHYLTGPRVHEFLHEMNLAVFDDRPGSFLTVGEMPGVTLEEAKRFTDPARREVDMVFQFEHVSLDQGPLGKWDMRPFRMIDLKRSFGRWQDGLGTTGWNSLYLDNHDQPRAVSRFGDDEPEFRERSAKALALVLHLHRGTPYVYQGEELGMTNVPFAAIDEFRDIESLNHFAAATAAGEDPDDVLAALRHRSRDNARTPMQWDDSPSAGFTTGRPWIDVNPNFSRINVAAQHGDPDSVLEFFRALIALRHAEPTIAHGDFTMVLPEDETVYAYTRSFADTELLVLANFSRETVTVPVEQHWATAEVLLDSYPTGWCCGTLRGWEAAVLRRRTDGENLVPD